MLEQQKPDDVKESYLWGYNGQYLMAKVLGSDYSTVSGLVTQATLTNGEANEALVPTQLGALRTSLASSNPTAQVTTYTYTGTSLKGVRSITDPNNKTIVYQYDAFGRVNSLNNGSESATGAVRASYCYNYAGQPTDCGTMAPTGSIAASGLTLIAEAQSPPLPVTLLDFNATKSERTAVLSWSTTSENNSKYFDIERSGDGKQWQRIGSIEARGESNSLQSYSFIDKNPMIQKTANGAENLYRLKMVDTDASFAYSRIRSVMFGGDGKTDLFPNPITIGQELNLLTDDLAKIGSIKFYNPAGRLVLESDAQKQIDTSKLESGLYIVQITYTDGSLSTHRIVKQ